MIRRSWVRSLAGAAGECSSPELIYSADLFLYPFHPWVPQQRAENPGQCVPVEVAGNTDTGQCVPVQVTENTDSGQCVPVQVTKNTASGQCVPVQVAENTDSGQCVPVQVAENSHAAIHS